MIFECFSLKDTKKVAEYFSGLATKGQCFALHGDLGFGKTTFSQFFIRALNPEIVEITSPTFTIVQTYESPIAEIWHVDCYRLKSSDEIFELGLEEAMYNCITLIEWPEIIQHLLPESTINIYFDKQNDKVTISDVPLS